MKGVTMPDGGSDYTIEMVRRVDGWKFALAGVQCRVVVYSSELFLSKAECIRSARLFCPNARYIGEAY